MNSIRLLLADPDRAFLDAISGRLAIQGYEVTRAGSVEEVRARLFESWFHLILLNIHMRDPKDPADTSGLTILQDEAFLPIPKFVVANYPTVALTRAFLRPGAIGRPMAVDFMGKESGEDLIFSALEMAIHEHVKVNWGLRIVQKEATSFLQIAKLLEPELTNLQLVPRADELENLLRIVFEKARQISIGRLISQRPGRSIIELTSFADEIQTYFVACSLPVKPDSVPSLPNNADHDIGKLSASSIHYNLNAFPANFSRPLLTLRETIAGNDLELIFPKLEGLMKLTLAGWHSSRPAFQPPEQFEQWVQDRIGINPDKLESTLSAICQDVSVHGITKLGYTPHRLTFYFSDDQICTLPNPAAVIGRRPLKLPESPIAFGLIHGRISGSTIIFDSNGRSWLVDLGQEGISPLVLDFANLEMTIRLEGMAGVNLEQCYHLEQYLEENQNPDAAGDQPSKWKAALQCIQLIRKTANADPIAYETGLFCAALAYLEQSYQPGVEFTPDEWILFMHSLLLSAMLCERLMKQDRLPSEAMESLWIDPLTQEVWVEGKRLELTPQDLALLAYLYQNRGVQCTRKQILSEALHNEVDNPAIEESRVNSAFSRLRQKIATVSKKNKYLETIRGIGYRLNI